MSHKYIERVQWHKWWELPTSWWQTWRHSTTGLQRVIPTCYNIWMQVSNLFKENWGNWKSRKIYKADGDPVVLHIQTLMQFFSGSVRRGGRGMCKFSGNRYFQGIGWFRFLYIPNTGACKTFTITCFLLLCPASLWMAFMCFCQNKVHWFRTENRLSRNSK